MPFRAVKKMLAGNRRSKIYSIDWGAIQHADCIILKLFSLSCYYFYPAHTLFRFCRQRLPLAH